MGYRASLRDRVEIQTLTRVDDGAGGFDATWGTVLRVACKVAMMSTREQKTYNRDGHANVYSVSAANPIPTTAGQTRLYDLCVSSSRDRMRLLYRGTRTWTLLGFASPDQGEFGTPGDMIRMDVEEMTRAIGVADA